MTTLFTKLIQICCKQNMKEARAYEIPNQMKVHGSCHTLGSVGYATQKSKGLSTPKLDRTGNMRRQKKLQANQHSAFLMDYLYHH